MSDPKATVTGVAAARVGGGPARGPEYDRLAVFIGKWITEGHTVASAGAASVKITASDVYEWAPGGLFIPREEGVPHALLRQRGQREHAGAELRRRPLAVAWLQRPLQGPLQ